MKGGIISGINVVGPFKGSSSHLLLIRRWELEMWQVVDTPPTRRLSEVSVWVVPENVECIDNMPVPGEGE